MRAENKVVSDTEVGEGWPKAQKVVLDSHCHYFFGGNIQQCTLSKFLGEGTASPPYLDWEILFQSVVARAGC